MTPGRHELARTYDAPPGADLPDLAVLPGVGSVDPPVATRLEAVYFDTTDLRLARAGITVCRRTGGDAEGWRLEVPGGDACHEVGRPPGRATATVPPALRTLLQAHVRDRRLTRVARVRTDRALHRLCDGEGRVLAELADDAVTAEAVRSDLGSRWWREWHVVVDADPDPGEDLFGAVAELLEGVAELLEGAGASPAGPASALHRALGTVPEDGPALDTMTRTMTRSGPAGRVVQARLVEQLRELERRDPLARADVADGVHDMRVAVRRLRSALATFRPLLDREATEPLRAELAWLAAQLGRPRDAEVARDRVADLLAAEPVRLEPHRLSAHAREEFESRHARAHRQVVEVLRSDRYLALLDRLEELVAAPPWTERAGLPADEVLPARVRHEWKRVRSRMRDVDEAATGSRAEEERLHSVRKAARRARYAAEAVAPVHGADAVAFAKAMKKLQGTLGEHHDSVLLQAELDQVATGQSDGHVAFGYGRLHAHEARRAERARGRYDKRRRAASRKKLRRWLA